MMSRLQDNTISAILLAAGRGARFGDAIPKQFHNVSGKMLLEWSLDIFLSHPRIADVCVVVHPGDKRYTDAIQTKYTGLTFVEGGKTRSESSYCGLSSLATAQKTTKSLQPIAQPKWVLIHDAARPFVSHAVIDRVIDALAHSPAVVPGIPVVDTLRAFPPQQPSVCMDRSHIWQIQTPQGFEFQKIYEAYQDPSIQGSQASFTDDASVLEHFGISCSVVKGCRRNIKVTLAEDLDHASARFPD